MPKFPFVASTPCICIVADTSRMKRFIYFTISFIIAGFAALLILLRQGQPYKQFLFLSVLTCSLSIAAIKAPFWSVLLYYFFAVLRPQNLWSWALPGTFRWSLISAVVVLFCVALHINRIVKEAKPTKMLGLFSVYGLLLLISMTLAFNPIIAQKWGVEYGKILSIAIVALFVVNRISHIKYLAILIFVCLGYIAWEINFLYFFRGGRLDIFHYGYGGLDNNGAALMIAMGIPFAYYVALSFWKKCQKLIFCIASLAGTLMLHAVMMSYSRGAMVSAVLGITWILLWHHSKKQAIVLATCACFAIGILAGDQIQERFLSTADYRADASALSRFDSWNAAWRITWDRPLFGQGIRNSNILSQNYGADRSGRTIHNQYLQVAADSGIPAALIFISIISLSFYNTFRVRMECLSIIGSGFCSDKNIIKLQHVEKICLACQGSMIVFAADCMFLSLEMFELPWLLFIISGVLPTVTQPLFDFCYKQEQIKIDEMRSTTKRIPPKTIFKKNTDNNNNDGFVLSGLLEVN